MEGKLNPYEHNPEKSKSREILLDCILKTFPDPKERFNMNVAFYTGPSLVEYNEVYSKAGIDPKNVFGIEKDEDRFRAVTEENNQRPFDQRINLFPGYDTELFAQDRKFHSIHLDYEGNYGPPLFQSLDEIFSPFNFSLADKSLLAINLQSQREHPLYQLRMRILSDFTPILQLLDLYQALPCITEYKNNIDMGVVNQILAANMFVALESYEYLLNGNKISIDLNAERTSVFDEVFLRSRYPLIRLLDKEDLDNFPKKCCLFDSELESDRTFKATENIGKLSELFFPTENELSDVLMLSILSSFRYLDIYPAAIHKYIPTSIDGRCGFKEGYITNRFSGLDVFDFGTFNYPGTHSVKMQTSIFSFSSPKKKFEESLLATSKGKEALNLYQKYHKAALVAANGDTNDFLRLMTPNGMFLAAHSLTEKISRNYQRLSNIAKKVINKNAHITYNNLAMDILLESEKISDKALTGKQMIYFSRIKNLFDRKEEEYLRRGISKSDMQAIRDLSEEGHGNEDISTLVGGTTAETIDDICRLKLPNSLGLDDLSIHRTHIPKKKSKKLTKISIEEADEIRALAKEYEAQEKKPKNLWEDHYRSDIRGITLGQISAIVAHNKIGKRKE